MKEQKDKKNSLLKSIWTTCVVIAMILLLFLTIGVAAIRITDTLPEGVDIFFIVGKEPSFGVKDDEVTWTDETEVSIFSSSYTNGENVTTVLSKEGDNVIAPGTVSVYEFCMYNDGNMAMSYDLDFSFDLAINGVNVNAQAFPLAFRLKRTDGAYVVGGEDKWVELEAGTLGEYSGTLGASSYEQFTLELMWAFEGNDELDTALGNEATKNPIDLTFKIGSYAENHSNPKAQGGTLVSETGEKLEYGGTIRWEWFILVIVLLVGLAFYLALRL